MTQGIQTGAESRGHVAVVDDEPFICDIVERALTKRHDVATFLEPEGLIASLEAGQRYDVIFCDLMMPGITGRMIHDMVLEQWPEQARRIVFMSGVSFTAARRGVLDGLDNKMIEKPFQLSQLRNTVEDALLGSL